MAKTAVINRKRRRSHSTKKRRRRNYGAAAANPPRRRRRRHYGSAAPARRRRGRRRNPVSPYAAGGYRRTPNPSGMFGLGQLIEIVPAGTLGIMGARFALRQIAGMAPGEKPGIWQALAIWLGANATGALMSHLFKSPSKGLYAKIAGLSFGGDLFARTRLLDDNAWAKANLSLAGMGDDEEDSTEYYDEGLIDGFQQQSALGDSYTDDQGATWTATDRGWALAGMGLDSGPGAGSRLAGMGAGQLVQGPDGTLYQLDGFQQQSALGSYRARSNPNSSFGYTP